MTSLNFKIRRSTPQDIDSMLHMIQNVHSQLNQKEWFVVDEESYTRELLETGKGWGYIAEEITSGEPAGLFIVNFPGTEAHNLGYDIFSSDAVLSEQFLSDIVHMDTAVVSPKYRGHHLQYRLISFAENDLKNAGYYKLMCTIHPENIYSLNNALDLGYRIMATREKYGGYLRHILLKEI